MTKNNILIILIVLIVFFSGILIYKKHEAINKQDAINRQVRIIYITKYEQPIVKPKLTFQEQELNCLTKNIYYEAAHEPFDGKLAVGFVTLNRVKHKAWPKSICGVVYQKHKRTCQFSWVCGVKKKFNQKEYKSASKIAKMIYTGGKTVYDNTNGSTHFHADYVWPEWSNELQYTTSIGHNVFYKFKRKSDIT